MLLFTASFLLYSLASPGNIPGDSEIRWSVARQIIRNKGPSIEDTVQTPAYAIGVDGKRYSFYGLGQSICMLPFAAMGLAMEKVAGINPQIADLAGQFLASVILFPAIGAMLVWLFYRLVIELGYSKSVSILTASVLGFATMNFHYSVNTQEQTQVALLLVLAIFLMVKYHRRYRFVYAWFFCVSLGVCLIFRLASAVMIFFLYSVVVATEVLGSGKKSYSKTVARWFFAGVLGTGGFIVVCGWYNFMRFGSVFESGYPLATATTLGGHRMFEGTPLPTLAGMLFSPGKSIFLYNPVLVLLPFCIWPFYRRHKVVALAVASVVVANFVLYSFATAWAGDYAWSIRKQVPVLPLLVLPLVILFNRPLKALAKTVVISVIVVSIMIQLASVVYNFNLEFVQNPNHHLIPDNYVWEWSQSHLRKRFENIIRHITDKRDFSSVKVINEEPTLLKYNRSEQSVQFAYRINFFPFKAKSMPPSAKLFYPLLCIWLVLLMAFCVVVFKLFQFHIGLKTENSSLPANIASGAEECR
jgi:hypothetical protein